MKIKRLSGREILDSRGNPTVEVVCQLESGSEGIASVPSGASKGVHEALELRDGDTERYGGLGVLKAVENVNGEMYRSLQGKEFDQRSLDEALIALDGTAHKSRLGANSILGVSLAFARASAQEKKMELFAYIGDLVGSASFALPQPFFNIINGGKHADSGLDIQEFLVAPVSFRSVREKVRVGEEIIVSLKHILEKNSFDTDVGDEGGFAPRLAKNEQAIEYIEEAIKNAGYTCDQVKVALDIASTSVYKNGVYTVKIDGEIRQLDSKAMIDWYKHLVSTYPIISIEDGLAEDDWGGFAEMNAQLGKSITIVGDDLTVTNMERIHTAIEKKAINAVLIKLNQIGTLSETIDAVELTKKQGWIPFVSHRSGETTDTFIADLAVGLSCPYFKSGSLTRGERVCKYNRLMEIEGILSGEV